jgi:cytochrome c oxidase assembly factor CtaG
MDTLPPFNWTQAATSWQFAPVVTAFAVVAAGLYLWGVARVRRRHPARPWPWWRTLVFLLGLLVVVVATMSGVGSYDDTLFWDHMMQHLLLLMVAPPLLVSGQPMTLLLHASRNPVHTWAKRALRSRPVRWVTWPLLGTALYAATVVGTHLTNFMSYVQSDETVHQAEHVLFLVVGYLYFLPLIGKEPIGWRVSYPLRLFLLFLAMPVDAFTGVVLGSMTTDPFHAMEPRPWGPSPVQDLHDGGAVMWIGGAAIMFVLILAVFFGWSRERRPSAGMGWLETARRVNLAAVTSEGVTRDASGAAVPVISESVDVDADDASLEAYNAYLARLNGPAGHSDPEQ